MTKELKSTLVIFTLFSSLPIFVPALAWRCHRCFSFQCPHDDETCKNIEDAVLAFGNQYFQPNKMPLIRCPSVDDRLSWKDLESSSFCEERNPNRPCSAVRFQVEIAMKGDITNNQLLPKKIRKNSFGTILGCSSGRKRELFRTLLLGNGQGSCIPTVHKTQNGTHVVTLEHCLTTCSDCDTCYENFCINPDVSTPKEFKERDGGRSLSWIIIGMFVGIPILIITVVLVTEINATGVFQY